MTDAAPLPVLHTLHALRMRDLDPLAGTAPLEVADPDAVEVLLADDGDAVAVLDVDETDLTSTMSLWVAPRFARLRLRATTDAAAAASSPLLRRAVAAAPDDLEVHVTTASRDLALVRPLLDAGFAAATVMAVRRETSPPPSRSPAAAVDGLVVRPADPASEADAASLTGHRVRLQRFESGVSLVPHRSDSETLMREAVTEQLRERPGWSWLAERDGDVVGSCEVRPPHHVDWALGATTGPRDEVAYLEDLHVAPGGRGSGVGSALVAAAHDALRTVGARTVLLHHGATNPLSVPFWSRAGYRPLHTTWIRVPTP